MMPPTMSAISFPSCSSHYSKLSRIPISSASASLGFCNISGLSSGFLWGVTPVFLVEKGIFFFFLVGSCLFPGFHYLALSSSNQKPPAIDSAGRLQALCLPPARALSLPNVFLVSVTRKAQELLTHRLINFGLSWVFIPVPRSPNVLPFSKGLVRPILSIVTLSTNKSW